MYQPSVVGHLWAERCQILSKDFPTKCLQFGALSRDEGQGDMGMSRHFGHCDHIRQWNKRGTHTHKGTIDVAEPDFLANALHGGTLSQG